MTEGLVATGCRALLRSRLLIPPGPAALPRFVREVVRGRANLVTLLGMAAARWPHRTAMIDDEGAISYRELLLCTDSLADQLQRRGSGPGLLRQRRPRGAAQPGRGVARRDLGRGA